MVDARCPCGWRLARKLTGVQSPSCGKHYARCVLCGRRGLRLKVLSQPWTIRYPPHETNAKLNDPGQPVCWFHEPIVPCQLLGKEHEFVETCSGLLCNVCGQLRRNRDVHVPGGC